MSNIKEAAVVDTTTGSTIPVLPETVAAAPAVEVEAAKETESVSAPSFEPGSCTFGLLYVERLAFTDMES